LSRSWWPLAWLPNVAATFADRIATSSLSLETSMPTTVVFCAIFQLPSLLGAGSRPMQLFGLKEDIGLSLAPSQALAFGVYGLRPTTGGCWTSRPFAHSAKIARHKGSCIHLAALDPSGAARRLPPLRAGRKGSLARQPYVVPARGEVVGVVGVVLHLGAGHRD